MTVSPLSHHYLQSLNMHISTVPFFKAIQTQSPGQYAFLMNHANVLELNKNEIVFKKGDIDTSIYFVLKGKLQVQIDSQDKSYNVNSITPGEVFGDIAVLYNRGRNARVVTDASINKHTVLSLDLAVFGQLTDFSLVSLSTKLAYYRNMTHNLRWKLEGYRMNYPQQAVTLSHRVVKLFAGHKDSIDELVSLDRQAKELANFLDAWNSYFKGVHSASDSQSQTQIFSSSVRA